MTSETKSARCPICGRFMRLGGRYANDHLDSWEESWTCSSKHCSEGVPGDE